MLHVHSVRGYIFIFNLLRAKRPLELYPPARTEHGPESALLRAIAVVAQYFSPSATASYILVVVVCLVFLATFRL